MHVQRVLAAAQKKLSPKSVKHVHTTIRRVLSQAVKWGLLPRNPASLVNSPRVPLVEIKVWTPEEAQRFLDAVKGHRLYAFFRLALATGTRRGELLGLQWRDVDLAAGTISVRRSAVPEGGKMVLQEPKTRAGIRTIAIGDSVAEVLRQHQAAQREEFFRLGLGRAVQVFASEVNTILPATTPRRVMMRYAEKVGVPHIPLHGLRHTCATMLLSAGAHPKVVAEMLGHADVGITLNVYSHVLPNLQREAAAAIDSLLR